MIHLDLWLGIFVSSFRMTDWNDKMIDYNGKLLKIE